MTLNLLVFVPLLGAAAAWWAGRSSDSGPRVTALTAAVVQFAVTVWAVADTLQGRVPVLTATAPFGSTMWMLRLDGLALPLVALTSLLGCVAVLASWNTRRRPGAHYALLLALQSAVTAVFLADNLILFYAAWEAVLIPMFFLIGGWGHEDRRHAAIKFFLYTFAGSALMLVGLVLVYVSTGTLRMSALTAQSLTDQRALVFWLLAAGFAVKIPVFPLHTWLPDAHVEAPTAGSIMLAGVLLKMGGYGFLRLALPIAPEVAHAAGPLFGALGTAGIVYGALMALAQTDLKRLVAYSSVSHMGFVVLAIGIGTPLALTAAMLTMVAHGLTAALLFLLVGMLYERTHTRALDRFGGLLRTTPAWGTAFVFASLASLGLPGLAGFPGEVATVLEAWNGYGWWVAAVAVGVVLAGAYNLRAVREVAQGAPASEWDGLNDIDARESCAIVPLVAGIIAVGLFPALVAAVASPVLSAIAGLVAGKG